MAIIAVLTAAAIPVFAKQLENSREATDAANIRAAYAAMTEDIISDPSKQATVMIGAGWSYPSTQTYISMKQKQAGWQNEQIRNSLVYLFKSYRSIERTIDEVKKDSYAWIAYGPGDSSTPDVWYLSFIGGTDDENNSNNSNSGNEEKPVATWLGQMTVEIKNNATVIPDSPCGSGIDLEGRYLLYIPKVVDEEGFVLADEAIEVSVGTIYIDDNGDCYQLQVVDDTGGTCWYICKNGETEWREW